MINLINISHCIIIDHWYRLRKIPCHAAIIIAVFTLNVCSDYYIPIAGSVSFVRNPLQYSTN